jgi:hypothetical protein
MYIYILIALSILGFLVISKEGFNNCEQRHKAISRYPKENLDLLFDAKFKPKCCPSPYSNSSGCLCNDMNHTELIKMRGGNRIMC